MTSNDSTTEPRTPEEIEADLARTREDLAETVEALSAKLDVKTRARDKVEHSRQRAGERLQVARDRAADAGRRGRAAVSQDDGSLKPAVPAGAGAVLLAGVGALVVVLVRRRRRTGLARVITR